MTLHTCMSICDKQKNRFKDVEKCSAYRIIKTFTARVHNVLHVYKKKAIKSHKTLSETHIYKFIVCIRKYKIQCIRKCTSLF